ncbi:MAG: DUF58 domain-containing protein [Burkholderiales bacterium]|nr:DUF58 domain-containing protein [Burkholderiales bacterium]
MNASAAPALRARLRNWIFQPRGTEAGEVFLNQRRVFIFPTRYGLLFAFSLAAFLAASINYDLALGFVLTFFLASAGLVAMLHTFRNQVHLTLAPARVAPVHAGQTARFELRLTNGKAYERAAIWLGAQPERVVVDVPPGRSVTVTLPVATRRRGWQEAPRITVETRYPLGLFRAWSYWQPDVRCLVWPAPAGDVLALPDAPEGTGDGAPRGAGTDDFGGLREYQVTDSPRHIAWKNAAAALTTGAPLLSKLFTGAASSELVFDLNALPRHLGLEDRLSLLTRWVDEATTARAPFTLRVPGESIGPAIGEAHRLACLKLLALVEPLPRNN